MPDTRPSPHCLGARGRNRTGMVLLPRDFKSLASTNFATRAWARMMVFFACFVKNSLCFFRVIVRFCDCGYWRFPDNPWISFPVAIFHRVRLSGAAPVHSQTVLRIPVKHLAVILAICHSCLRFFFLCQSNSPYIENQVVIQGIFAVIPWLQAKYQSESPQEIGRECYL